MNPQNMPPLTEEQKKDVADRVQAFEKDLMDLSKKYMVEIIAFPQLAPSPYGFVSIATVGVKDKKFEPVPSPLTDAVRSNPSK